jgi:hypothetical protein
LKKLFSQKGLPPQISRADFWEIWFSFLTIEAYGKNDFQQVCLEGNSELQTCEGLLIGNDEFEEVPVGYFHFFAYFSSAFLCLFFFGKAHWASII